MEKSQTGKLILDGVTFELNDCSDTKLYIFESDEYDGTITVSFDAMFIEEQFYDEKVSPYLCINPHETHKSSINELTGYTYSAETFEDADEREDTLYIYEHEPLKYSFTILEVKEETVHIQIKGTAITDGYAEPCKTAEFFGDMWLRYENE